MMTGGGRLEVAIEHSLVQALRRVPGFDVLDDRDLLRVVGVSVNLAWPKGSMVFEKGSPGDALYIVLSGEVRIYDEVAGTEVEITRTGPGDFFGEISLLLDSEHTKNVQAVEDSELLVLMKEPFWALLEKRPDLAEIVQKRLEERRTETQALYEESRS
jgi:CRP-like cAMP-binding protein